MDEQGGFCGSAAAISGSGAMPFGRMEIGETPIVCAVRETQETGFEVETTGLLGSYSWGNRMGLYQDIAGPDGPPEIGGSASDDSLFRSGIVTGEL